MLIILALPMIIYIIFQIILTTNYLNTLCMNLTDPFMDQKAMLQNLVKLI